MEWRASNLNLHSLCFPSLRFWSAFFFCAIKTLNAFNTENYQNRGNNSQYTCAECFIIENSILRFFFRFKRNTFLLLYLYVQDKPRDKTYFMIGIDIPHPELRYLVEFLIIKKQIN